MIKEYQCRECGNTFSWNTDKPGRPAVRCENCREIARRKKEQRIIEVKAKLSPAEVVERLEFNLKAAGLHISQHPDKY